MRPAAVKEKEKTPPTGNNVGGEKTLKIPKNKKDGL